LPLYAAVSECAPAVKVDIVNTATPALRVPVPREVEPSWNVTVPVAEDGLTVAVIVTDWPSMGELGVTDRVMVVVERPTASVIELDVLAA